MQLTHRLCVYVCGCTSPQVTFCGYSIPHPAENKMNIRLQTAGACASPGQGGGGILGSGLDGGCLTHQREIGERADVTFRRGLDNIIAVCEHVKSTFDTRTREFEDGPTTAMEH